MGLGVIVKCTSPWVLRADGDVLTGGDCRYIGQRIWISEPAATFGASCMVRFWLMATYLVIALGSSAEALDRAVQTKAAKEDSHQIESGKWLVSSTLATSKDVSDWLGIGESALFFLAPVRGYFGRAKPDVWEWLAAKTMKANG